MSSAAELGRQVLADVQTSLGDDYETLSAAQKASIEQTATMLMGKQLELSTQPGAERTAELEAQIQALESTVQDWKVWGVLALEDAFWEGVKRAAETLGSFLAAFATEAIGRIVPGL